MKYLFLLVIIFSQVLQLQAQEPAWLKRISIRQSFESDDAKENPAILSLTFPKDTNSSYLVDVAVSYRLSADARQSYGSLTAEYHRTNLIDEEVNNLQVGYKHKWTLKKPTVIATTFEQILSSLEKPYHSLILNSSAKFRRDKIEGATGFASSFLFSYFKLGNDTKKSIGIWNIAKDKPGKTINNNNRFAWMFLPEFGMEFQHNFKADKTEMEGFVGRGVGKFNLTFGTTRPNPKSQFVPLFKWLFTADVAARYDVIGKQYTDSKFHPLINASLDIYLVNDKPLNLILGGSFTYGDSPVEGFREFKFEPQQVWVIAIKIKK